MQLTSKDLADLISSDESPRNRDDCPGAEMLTRASADELSRSEREFVARHIATCVDCAEEFQMLRPLHDWADAAGRGSAEPIPTPSFRPEAIPAQKPGGFWHQASASLFSARPAYGLVGLFVIATIALAVWVVELQKQHHAATLLADARLEQERALSASRLAEETQKLEERIRGYEQQLVSDPKAKEIAELRGTVDELSRSHVNAPIINLEPQGSRRGGAEASVKTIELPAGVNAYVVVLNLAGELNQSRYLLEIEDRTGALVRREPGLRKNSDDTFTLILTRGLLQPGQYHFKLYGAEGQKKLIEDYPVTIQYK